MNILANIRNNERTVNREGWQIEIIRRPRPSCLDALKRRETLRSMLPGDTATIAGVEVKRLNSAHIRCCYKINGRALNYADALALIEKPVQLALPLGVAS